MASPVLHIKDSYYFEVPKIFWEVEYSSKSDFPDHWVRLDPSYQMWEAERLHGHIANMFSGAPSLEELNTQYRDWRHDHANFGKPLDAMLEEAYAEQKAEYGKWLKVDGNADKSFADFVDATAPEFAWFTRSYDEAAVQREWNVAKSQAEDVAAYKALDFEWSPEKIAGYNKNLSGKIVIPQPFGTIKNLYEPESGFCISKFLVVELLVALVMCLVFGWLAKRVASGGAPHGRLWNLLEVFLVYLRDNIARPVIGGGHDDHGDGDHGDSDHGDSDHGEDGHGMAHSEHGHVHAEADKFVPLLWTVFMFVLGCNLCGMLPWVGSPTGTFGVTTGLALATLGTGVCFGILRFGPLGFFTNMIPSMDLPLVMAVVIKPMLLVIEVAGYLIKHAVLAIRLLANMVAGHLVLLGIMGLAFGAVAATEFADSPDWLWWTTAAISVVASALFSCLELFVAFLQAYIFTFLSALFISASIHHH